MQITLISWFVILAAIIAGFLMIDTAPSQKARDTVTRSLESIPGPSGDIGIYLFPAVAIVALVIAWLIVR